MGPGDLSSVFTLKGMSRKLLLLGTVVGTLSFLSPAYAEVWTFDTPILAPGTVLNNYVGSAGTVVQALGRQSGGTLTPLVTKTAPIDEMGLGLANDPSGENEIAPGNWISLNLGNIPVALRADLSFQANSTTDGETWQVWGAVSSPTTPGSLGTTLLGSCTAPAGSGPGNACEDLTTLAAVPAGDSFLLVTALNGNVLLSELDTTEVPLPGAMLLFGTGLAGLGFVGRRRRSKKVSVLQAA